jgi:MFS transporter, DHA2 family, multidrug resistance protein
MGIVFGVALFGTTFILPQFTQYLLGYPAFEAGLVLLPRAIMLLMFMPIAGRLYRHFDARILVIAGISVIFCSYYGLSKLSLEAGFWNLVPTLLIMGAGMPVMFVTMSTVSLSTIPRPDMTNASSLYTLARSVGGNIGYALAATWVARGIQIHRTHLVAHLTASNPAMLAQTNAGAALLSHSMIGASAAPQATLALTNALVNRQATMMAYNDTSLLFGILFLITIPLALFLPRRSELRAAVDRRKAKN